MIKPLVIDVEASGFGAGSYPIEIGVALEKGQTQCMLIRREPEWHHWSASAESLHAISRESLDQHGYSVKEVALKLNEWLSDSVVYTDGWGNDSSWIALLFDSAGLSQRFKLESLRSILTEEQVQHWHETKHDIENKSGFQRHRASNDALVIQQTYCVTAENSRELSTT
jgi:hypothetical protein